MRPIAIKKTGVVVIFAVVLIAVCSIPFKRSVTLSINATYLNCYTQLITVGNWRNWLPGINQVYNRDSSQYKLYKSSQEIRLSVPGQYFIIKQLSSNNLSVTKVTGNHNFTFSYAIVPTKLGTAAVVVVDFKTNVIKYLLSAFVDGDLKNTAVNDFKAFMEDTKRYYGFDIKRGFENERKIIVQKRTIAAKNIYTAAADMQKQILNYIAQNKLSRQGHVMAQYKTKSNDSTEMMIGIPVDREITATRDFLYMRIPPTRELIADFDGTYAGRQKIYTAVSNYLQDKFLTGKISPLEVFRGNFPGSENDRVAFQLIYPIF
jgi:hypothetical protein